MLTLDLHRALARQSLDALAREFVRRWKPAPPDKRRTARSFAAEIRRLAKGQARWFHNRPEASKVLAKILGSTPAKLGLVRVAFEIQSRDRDSGQWITHADRPTLESAEDFAWSLLTQHGGDWRVRHEGKILARGFGYRPGEPGQSHDRTAVWSRTRATPKKRRHT